MKGWFYKSRTFNNDFFLSHIQCFKAKFVFKEVLFRDDKYFHNYDVKIGGGEWWWWEILYSELFKFLACTFNDLLHFIPICTYIFFFLLTVLFKKLHSFLFRSKIAKWAKRSKPKYRIINFYLAKFI